MNYFISGFVPVEFESAAAAVDMSIATVFVSVLASSIQLPTTNLSSRRNQPSFRH